MVTIGLGTPEERLTVVFDTGRDTTWVQCEPCESYCYRQMEPLFSPAKSRIAAHVPGAAVSVSSLSSS